MSWIVDLWARRVSLPTMAGWMGRIVTCCPPANTSRYDRLALFSEFFYGGLGGWDWVEGQVADFPLGLGGLGVDVEGGDWGLVIARSDLDRTQSEVGRKEGQTGTRAILATGRPTGVCSVERGTGRIWCRVQICGPIAVLASWQAARLCSFTDRRLTTPASFACLSLLYMVVLGNMWRRYMAL